MDQRTKELTANLLKRIFRLAGMVRVDLDGNTGRLLPIISPSDLWRSLPGLLRESTELAKLIEIKSDIPGLDSRFVESLCAAIERGAS